MTVALAVLLGVAMPDAGVSAEATADGQYGVGADDRPSPAHVDRGLRGPQTRGPGPAYRDRELGDPQAREQERQRVRRERALVTEETDRQLAATAAEIRAALPDLVVEPPPAFDGAHADIADLEARRAYRLRMAAALRQAAEMEARLHAPVVWGLRARVEARELPKPHARRLLETERRRSQTIARFRARHNARAAEAHARLAEAYAVLIEAHGRWAWREGRLIVDTPEDARRLRMTLGMPPRARAFRAPASQTPEDGVTLGPDGYPQHGAGAARFRDLDWARVPTRAPAFVKQADFGARKDVQ